MHQVALCVLSHGLDVCAVFLLLTDGMDAAPILLPTVGIEMAGAFKNLMVVVKNYWVG
jgi:hypothetical protein